MAYVPVKVQSVIILRSDWWVVWDLNWMSSSDRRGVGLRKGKGDGVSVGLRVIVCKSSMWGLSVDSCVTVEKTLAVQASQVLSQLSSSLIFGHKAFIMYFALTNILIYGFTVLVLSLKYIYSKCKTFQHYDGFVILSHWCSTHVCGLWNVSAYRISKENFLCRLYMHFANLWLLLCLLRGMFGWNLAFQVLLTSLPWNVIFLSQPLSLGGNDFVIQYIYHFIFGFMENLNRAWALFPCCLTETN